MPKYNFVCESCSIKTHKYVSAKTETVVCTCGKNMHRQLPVIEGQTEVRELIDPYLNKRHVKDQDTLLKDRRRTHFADVEIPRLVDTYSVETCLENKWLVYNDKGELVINKNWVPSGK
jgi:hypothetical protein